jgi:hypothetical protein
MVKRLIPGKELQIPTGWQARYAPKISGLGSEEKELCQLSGIESTVSDFLT